MNLVCAHHVLLVHPMYADRSSDAASCEMQAIGRVRRQGQQHTVHVHRFVVRDTVEESLAHRHHSLCIGQQAAAAVEGQAKTGQNNSDLAPSIIAVSSAASTTGEGDLERTLRGNDLRSCTSKVSTIPNGGLPGSLEPRCHQ